MKKIFYIEKATKPKESDSPFGGIQNVQNLDSSRSLKSKMYFI